MSDKILSFPGKEKKEKGKNGEEVDKVQKALSEGKAATAIRENEKRIDRMAIDLLKGMITDLEKDDTDDIFVSTTLGYLQSLHDKEFGDESPSNNLILIPLYFIDKLPGVRVSLDEAGQHHITGDGIDPKVTAMLEILMRLFIDHSIVCKMVPGSSLTAKRFLKELALLK